MNHIKQQVFNRFKTFSLLSLSIIFSMVILMVRIKLAHSFFYLFLIWNVFLATIPFAVSSYLLSVSKLNIITLIFWYSLWPLFLPNAPYIVTDLVHLNLKTQGILWLDILVIISFAFNRDSFEISMQWNMESGVNASRVWVWAPISQPASRIA